MIARQACAAPCGGRSDESTRHQDPQLPFYAQVKAAAAEVDAATKALAKAQSSAKAAEVCGRA